MILCNYSVTVLQNGIMVCRRPLRSGPSRGFAAGKCFSDIGISATGGMKMRKPCYVLCLAFAAASVTASTARADSVVTLTVTEITVINAPVQSINTGVPLTFESNDEILSIGIDWAATGTANFPFPAVFGAEDSITLDDGFTSSVCNDLVQTGASSFQAVDCPGGVLAGPFVSTVTFSGNWGTAEIGFAGNEPIIIDSTFMQRTITPEPGSVTLLGIGLVGLASLAAGRRRFPPAS